ncbi:MAG: cupin domain-containing protein [Syntrophorhabdales bacterium]|jgi:quercetin dioxygenase-like cupin family protein
MKRHALLAFFAIFFLSCTMALAAPGSKVVGDARSVDTKYAGPFNVNLEKWFAAHPVEPGKMLRLEPMFQTPRVVVASLAAAGKGQLLDLHYHRYADELMFVIKGQCEEYIDGKWVLTKAGDMHYNPRGVIHAGRVVGEGPFMALAIFTPPPPPDDRVFLNSETTAAKADAKVGDWSLLDTQYKRGYNFNLDEWYASHPIETGKSWRSDPAMGTLRSQLMIAQKPTLGVHYHGSADEIIYAYKGAGEMYINGEWVKINAGETHFCPRGFIHGIRPVGSGEFKIFAVFAPPQANGADRIFVDFK